MSDFWPKISVVTPSFQQAQFIEQTIQSVLGQNYPNLEYIIMDGGSTDGTVEILKRYASQLTHWESQKDNGQSHAINKGFRMATGDIFCWLNSDDYFLPGTLHEVAAHFKNQLAEAKILAGNCIHIDAHKHHSFASHVVRSFQQHPLHLYDPLIQPSTFWTRKVWEQTGELREDLHFVFDWEWFLRAQQKGTTFDIIEDYFSVYRIHSGHKSGSGSGKRKDEIYQILLQNNPPVIAESYLKMSALGKEIKKAEWMASKLRVNAFTILKMRFEWLKNIDQKTFYLLKTLAS